MAPATCKKVLLVEVNAILREGTAFVLRQAGYDVVTATNGREALDLLTSGPAPNLVLTNMMMPVCDGWQFLREWKGLPASGSVPVVIISTLGVGSPEWARSLGAVDFLRLPVEPEDLLAVLRRHLGS